MNRYFYVDLKIRQEYAINLFSTEYHESLFYTFKSGIGISIYNSLCDMLFVSWL